MFYYKSPFLKRLEIFRGGVHCFYIGGKFHPSRKEVYCRLRVAREESWWTADIHQCELFLRFSNLLLERERV